MSDTTDLVQACAAVGGIVVSIASTFLIVVSLRQASQSIKNQQASADVATTLQIWEKIDTHWRLFRKSDQDDREFEFGQLITYYEMACHLFRTESLSTKSSTLLFEHLRDILPTLLSDPTFCQMFENIRNDDANYENINWLCRIKDDIRVPQRKCRLFTLLGQIRRSGKAIFRAGGATI